MTICLIIAYYINHFSNIDIYFFSTHYTLGLWSHFIACRYPNFSSILQFFNVCQWKFDIIIIFNAIAITFQTSSICSTNWYFILKLLVLNSTGKLYDDKHFPQNRCFLLPLGSLYFCDGLVYPSHPFHSLQPSYLSHFLHYSDPSYIMLSHS